MGCSPLNRVGLAKAQESVRLGLVWAEHDAGTGGPPHPVKRDGRPWPRRPGAAGEHVAQAPVRHPSHGEVGQFPQLRPPQPDHPIVDLSKERIQRRPVLGGLINEYERAA
jgi:hypothetical protein